MLQWFRDLIRLFKRPINGDVPNFGNIPQEILEKRFFGDAREEENWKIIDRIAKKKK